MAVSTGNFGELLEPGLRKLYGDAYKQYPEEYSQVFNVEGSSKNFEEDLSLAALGLVPAKPEGQAVSYDTAYQGTTHRYTHSAYGLGFMVTREMFEDDLYRKMKTMPQALARSVRHSIELLAANVLNRAFNSSYTGIDSLEMCSTVHTTIAAGTYQNELTTAADLSVTSLEQAYIDIAALIDERGLKMAAKPTKLIVHPNDVFNAQTILKTSQEVGSANNDINTMKGAMPYTTLHWLTDSDAWFVLTDVPNGMNFFWRRKPEFTRDNDFDSENAKFKTTYRCSVGWTDPRGIYGSPGA